MVALKDAEWRELDRQRRDTLERIDETQGRIRELTDRLKVDEMNRKAVEDQMLDALVLRKSNKQATVVVVDDTAYRLVEPSLGMSRPILYAERCRVAADQ